MDFLLLMLRYVRLYSVTLDAFMFHPRSVFFSHCSKLDIVVFLETSIPLETKLDGDAIFHFHAPCDVFEIKVHVCGLD